MSNEGTQSGKRPAIISYFSLFTSLGTLLCCALPSLLVLLGFGASVGSLLTSLPWLVTLSHNKKWTFAISGIFIALSFVNMYYLAPRRAQACTRDSPSACAEASRFSTFLLWTSAVIYAVGFFVAYALGPILTKIDGAAN